MAKKYGFSLDKSLADKELGDSFYTGETPPKGNYHGNLKLLAIKKNKNDDDMLNYLLEIQEEGDKAKFNGYGIWGNLNVTEQGAAWLNNFLDALGPKAKADFYAGNVTVDGANPPNILKIGSLKPIGVPMFASCKIETYNGEGNLRVGTFLIEEGGKKKKGKSEPEPDEEAEGLEDPDEADEDQDDDADDTEADEAEDEDGEEEDEEQYTEEDLTELDPKDLREILDGWEVEYAPKATKATLIKTILAQYEEADDEEAEDEEEEQSDDLTEEDMGEMSPDELKEYITEKGWKMPKPPVRSKLMKTILENQAEPPF